MKVILLAAAGGEPAKKGFPSWSSKPKILYSCGGQIQLERIINQLLEAGFEQKDIEIVIGFKYQKVIEFLDEKKFNIKVKINHNWKKSATYTLLKAIEGIDEDFFLLSADENRDIYFYRQIFAQKGKRHHDISSDKLLKEDIPLFHEVLDEYKNKKIIKNEFPSENGYARYGKETYHLTHSGNGLSCIVWELFRRIKKFEKVELTHSSNWCGSDLDYFSQTDEYKSMSFAMKFLYYLSYFVHRAPYKTIKYFRKAFLNILQD